METESAGLTEPNLTTFLWQEVFASLEGAEKASRLQSSGIERLASSVDIKGFDGFFYLSVVVWVWMLSFSSYMEMFWTDDGIGVPTSIETMVESLIDYTSSFTVIVSAPTSAAKPDGCTSPFTMLVSAPTSADAKPDSCTSPFTMLVSAPTSADAKPDGFGECGAMHLIMRGTRSETTLGKYGAARKILLLASIRYWFAFAWQSVSGVFDGGIDIMLAPRDTALDCGFFAKLAKATANLGKMVAHLESIRDASIMSFVAFPKQSKGVMVSEEVGDMLIHVVVVVFSCCSLS
jgi:hypothetical protein